MSTIEKTTLEIEPTGEKWREGSLEPYLVGITHADELGRVKNFFGTLAGTDGLMLRNNILMDQLYGCVPDCRAFALGKMKDGVRHRDLLPEELPQDPLVGPYYWLWRTEPDIDLEVLSTVDSDQVLKFTAATGIVPGRHNLMSDGSVWRQIDVVRANTDSTAQIVRYQYRDLRAGLKGRTVFTIATDHPRSFRHSPCFNLDSLTARVAPDLTFCFTGERPIRGEILEAERFANDSLRAIYVVSRAIYFCAAHHLPLRVDNSVSFLRRVILEANAAQLPPSITRIVQRNSVLAALFDLDFTLGMEEQFGLQGFV